MPEGHAPTVDRVIEVVWQDVWRFKVQQIHRLEIVSEQKVQVTVVVVIESDCGDGVAKLVEARGGGNVLEFAVPFVVIKKRRAETDDK